MEQYYKKVLATTVILSIIISSIFGGIMGFWAGVFTSQSGNLFSFFKNPKSQNTTDSSKVVTVEEESAVINTVEKSSPAVVSIIVTKDLPILEQYYSEPFSNDPFFQQFFGDMGDFFGGTPQYRQKGTQKQEVGGGTGFIVSADGHIVTNKHVVSDESAEYTVLMNDGTKHPAKVLARDPINDIAIIKIDGKNLSFLEFADSSKIKVGQSVIAIGNSLGEFRNTVSTGVISGLSRSVSAGGYGLGSEQLTGVIQTDASINPGNSGGPLLNLAGQVVGVNTAMAQGAENIGFALPSNLVKNIYENVQKNGRIIRPWLGIRYTMIDKSIAEQNKLDVDYGALIIRGDNKTDLAVIPGSPADKAGLVENDIVLELNGKKVDADNPLTNQIGQFNVGDTITLKVLHKGEKKDIKVKLEEMK
jgi:serine protease Do